MGNISYQSSKMRSKKANSKKKFTKLQYNRKNVVTIKRIKEYNSLLIN
jgi:hypothetical protein